MFKANSITSKVVFSGLWSYLRIALSGLFNLIVMAILARLLEPKDFGIVALASVILRALVILGEEGFSQYVIFDNDEEKEKRVYGAFWLNFLFSVATSIFSLALLPVVNYIYGNKEIGTILAFLILRFFIESLAYIPDSLLKKRLDFAKLEIRNLIIDVLSGIISVSMAIKGYGVWSLVIPSLVLSPTRFIISALTVPWFPKMSFFTKTWKKIFDYSKHLVGSTLITLFLNEGDTLLVGKLLSVEKLGLYNLAFRNANMPVKNLSMIANKVSFPAFSMLNNDKEKIYEGWVRMERLLATISFFILVFLFVMADEFILGIYGAKWKEAIFPLRILIFYSLRQSVGNVAASIFRAVGRTDLGLKLGLILLPFYLIGIYVGSFWGIIGVALGVTVSRTVIGMLNFYFVGKCLKKKFIEVVKPLFKPLQIAFYFALAMAVFKYTILSLTNLSLLVKLAISLLFAICFYLFMLRVYFSELSREIYKVAEPILGETKYLALKLLGIKN